MADVATDDERNGNDVMREHLGIVLATRLDVDHDELMHPAGQLAQVVEFDGAGGKANRIVHPKVFRLQGEARQVDVYTLRKASFSTDELGTCPNTYHPKRPENSVVCETPALLSKANDVSLV
jgi:hypothetical protein